MRKALSRAMVTIALLTISPALAAPPTITAKWAMKYPASATEDARTDRGSKTIPLQGTPECLSKFKVSSLGYSVDLTNSEDVAKFMAGKASLASVDIRLVKSAKGRMPVPELLVSDGKVRHRFAFEVDVNRWASAGYKFGGTFHGDKVAFVPNWTSAELICPTQ